MCLSVALAECAGVSGAGVGGPAAARAASAFARSIHGGVCDSPKCARAPEHSREVHPSRERFDQTTNR